MADLVLAGVPVMARVARAVLGASAALLAPASALACPVCFAARDHAEQLAFLGSTVLLTSLPVIMVGGVIVWIARRARVVDGSNARRKPAPSGVPHERASEQVGVVATGASLDPGA